MNRSYSIRIQDLEVYGAGGIYDVLVLFKNSPSRGLFQTCASMNMQIFIDVCILNVNTYCVFFICVARQCDRIFIPSCTPTRQLSVRRGPHSAAHQLAQSYEQRCQSYDEITFIDVSNLHKQNNTRLLNFFHLCSVLENLFPSQLCKTKNRNIKRNAN